MIRLLARSLASPMTINVAAPASRRKMNSKENLGRNAAIKTPSYQTNPKLTF